MDQLTHQQVLACLSYDPETGIFVRRVDGRNGRDKAGSTVGCRNTLGYLQATVCGRRVYLHRLAVFYMTGAWPPEDVDHRDTDRSNNRWANLRCVSRGVNCQNRVRSRKDRVHGTLMGTKLNHGRWTARINHITLGTFDTEAEAHQSYVAAKRQLHEGCTL